MWARVVELMLACWLAISPFVFDLDPGAMAPAGFGYAAAFIVGVAALLSFHRRLYRAHLVTLLVAALLVVLAFIAEGDPPPAPYQNFMVVGLLLMMFAIIPSNSGEPPRRWTEYTGELKD